MDTADQHAAALAIVHEEAGRTLSKNDFDLCMRIAKRALGASSEHEKAMADAVIYGTGIMKDDQHVPLDQVRAQPDERAESDMRAAFEVRPGLGDWPKEGHECAYENGDGICRECAALAELEKVRSRIEQAVTEHYTGDDLWIATSLAARALLARATAPQATNDPMAVVRLKAICKLLGLERAIPVGTYADPEGLFVIFGMMRSKIETLHCATRTPIYQIGANAGGGIAWWDVDKDRYEREKKAGYMKTGIVYREGQ